MDAPFEISDEALDFITEFVDAVRVHRPDVEWIGALIWSSRGRKGAEDAAEWEDLGIGLTLGIYERGEAPAEKIVRVRGVHIAAINGSGHADPFQGKKVGLSDGNLVLTAP